MSELIVTGRDLRLSDLLSYERERPRLTLCPDARARMEASAAAVRRAVASEKPSYGINTGFGAFANTRISISQVRELQYNLVRSHAAGVGDPLPAPLVRRLMLLKANNDAGLVVQMTGGNWNKLAKALGLLRHPAPDRGHAAVAAQRGCSAYHPRQGFGRRFGRSGAAGASGSGADRRR